MDCDCATAQMEGVLMRLLAVLFLMSVSPGYAASSICPSGSPSIVAVEGWSAEKSKDVLLSAISLTLQIRNATEKDIRLIDGSVVFQDVLGATVGSVGIDRDVLLPAGTVVEQKGSYLSSDLDRLLVMSRGDLVVESCTRAAVFSDGTKSSY